MDEPAPVKPVEAANPGNPGAAPPRQSVKYLSDLLENAELLLEFAAGAGIKVPDDVRDAVLKARFEKDAAGFTEPTAASLINAFTTLASIVSPVTVRSLTSNAEDARKTIQKYGWSAGVIASFILLISMITFVSSSISQKIMTDVDTANALAAKLTSELGPPAETNQAPPAESAWISLKSNIPWRDVVWYGTNGIPPGLSDQEVLTDFQHFAATMREIDGYARELNVFIFKAESDPYETNRADRKQMREILEFHSESTVRLAKQLADKIVIYQDIRNFGNCVQQSVTVWYGALATCILPVLYALLGAGAFLMRLFEDQSKNRTLNGGDNHIARFLIAGIGGLVVGLFNNITQGVSISPFAVAFLVGYAADAFFTFLEGMLQIFKRGPGNTGAT